MLLLVIQMVALIVFFIGRGACLSRKISCSTSGYRSPWSDRRHKSIRDGCGKMWVQEMKVIRSAQLTGAMFTAVFAIYEYSFMAATEAPRFPAPTAVLYVGFFWVLWAYARVARPILSLIKLRKLSIWLLLASLVAVMLVTYCYRASESNDITAFNRFMPIHAFLIAGYSLISAVLLFGDDFLWPVSKALKFGREFKR